MARRCGGTRVKVKMYKTSQGRSHFSSSDLQKWHAAVAKVKRDKTPHARSHFSSSKMARRCGANHICKSKCSKTHGFGSLFEVQMSKNGTRLWREAHVQVKMYKISVFGTLFEVQMLKM